MLSVKKDIYNMALLTYNWTYKTVLLAPHHLTRPGLGCTNLNQIYVSIKT